jgi:hypothetical protein
LTVKNCYSTAAWSVVFWSLLALVPAHASPPGVPDSRQMLFEVYMEGDPVGRDTYTFRMKGDELVAQRRVTLSSSWGPFTLFTYEHESTGTWRDGQLQQLSSRTIYNGDETRVRVDRRDTQLVIREGERPGSTPGGILPTSWWNPSTRSAEILLDTQHGRLRSVEVVHQGTERVALGDETISADRYDLQGDLELSLWYGPDRELVSIQFERKGYTFRYRRVQ